MKTLWISIKVIAKVLLFGKKAFVENHWEAVCRG
ncbi:hypothetical protein J2S06_002207 [Bacillus alveayuensis]|uniref:Uncharacterized protein n=1 Tax=Aeribacillus alveayuensis TaxID=279215 RepID=A0ABT9VQG5_9BACI|nr:hypothetical protein [Bacillus alveayuensis]